MGPGAVARLLAASDSGDIAMVFVVMGEAKPEVTLDELRANRKAFIEWEQASPYAGRYTTVARYEWVGGSPKKTFWVMEAEEPATIHGLVEFFNDVWNVTAYPVVQRGISDTV
ncbi:MAG: hypothetical protein CL611_01770 [Anaerolineaceae bacterium]|jgi:hypothetical protein|nr:hypothetical protein [Anaerolineaceae bacterium]